MLSSVHVALSAEAKKNVMGRANGGVDSSEATALKRLLEVSVVVLQQAVDLLDNFLTSDDQLTIHSKYMPGSTIGEAMHRHYRIFVH